MNLEHFVEAAARELVLFAAAGFLIGGIDELLIDLAWAARAVRRLFVFRKRPRAAVASLPPAATGRFAVFIPAWDESAVIGAMLRHLLASFGDCVVYVAVYPNDPATRTVLAGFDDPRLRIAVTDRPGPTTKADALNTLWRAMATDEVRNGERYLGVVLHDAEDVVHPDELHVFAGLIDRFALIQLPVLPLVDCKSRWVAGTYLDEFAEHHGKTLLAREETGAGVPSAAAGSAEHPARRCRQLHHHRIELARCRTVHSRATPRARGVGQNRACLSRRHDALKPRLGPLGTPLAIMLVWVAVRIALLVPAPDELRKANQRPVSRHDPATQFPTPASGQEIGAGTRTGVMQRRKTLLAASRKYPLPQTDLAISVSPAVVPRGGVTAFAASGVLISEPPFHGRSGRVTGYAAARRSSHRGLSGSAWELINGTGGAAGVPSLGGSQAGMRLFLQGDHAPFALTARLSQALGAARDAEVSAGYALRGHGFGLLIERRQRLDVNRGAFIVTGYGGVYDVHLPAGLRFGGFAQGGVAGAHQRRWFADGQVRITARSPLSTEASLGVGGGVWASAQQSARRVEAGPILEARLRGNAGTLRIAGEYRFRLTGDARPRSGPALTVGLDF